MKQLEKKDLIIGETYIQQWYGYFYIFKLNTLNIGIAIKNVDTTFFKKWYSQLESNKPLRLATPEEKHWLETCIKENKFISYEEAMKSFIPEYVEWIDNIGSDNLGYQTKDHFKKNKIFKTDVELPSHGFQTQNWIKHLEIYANNYKPSTKEAYDAQFVVKDEFVLPEKWYTKITSENKDIINHWRRNIIQYNNSDCQYETISQDGSGSSLNFTNEYKSYQEITFEQFKKYVLKEDVKVLEEPKDKVLEKEGIYLNIGKIIRVESSEGAIYQLGDKITVFTKDSPNKGKVFTIKGFRWSNDKSKICAVTELHTPNGIGLDKIELYVEPKVKIIDDFVLPENWYIKVTDDNKEVLQQYIRNLHDSTMITLSNINYIAYSKWLNGINQTENKLGYGLISKLNLNPLPNIYRTVTYYNGEEITFEQFEQYVLHNGFKIGDRFDKQKYLYNSGITEVGEREIIDLQYINNESVAFYKIIENDYSGPQYRILTKNIVR